MKTHTLSSVRLFPLIAVMLLLTLHGCSDSGSSNPVSPGDSEGDWTVGTAVEYTVYASSKIAIEDSVSGCTVLFPEGGDGTLSVASVTSGPDLAFDTVQFAVSFTGDETVQIMTPVEDGGYTALFEYTTLENAAIDSRAGNVDWWGIPGEESLDGYNVFTIQSSGKVLGKSAGINAAPDSKKFALARVTAGSSDAQKMAAVEKTVKQVVDYWLDNLPSGISTAARNQVNGDLKYTITWSNSGNAYQHSNSWIGSNAKFFLEKNVDFATIAHEVGTLHDTCACRL